MSLFTTNSRKCIEFSDRTALYQFRALPFRLHTAPTSLHYERDLGLILVFSFMDCEYHLDTASCCFQNLVQTVSVALEISLVAHNNSSVGMVARSTKCVKKCGPFSYFSRCVKSRLGESNVYVNIFSS